jgi:hypothetical protein
MTSPHSLEPDYKHMFTMVLLGAVVIGFWVFMVLVFL